MKILFTLTTVLSRPDKRKQAIACLESIESEEPHLSEECYVLVVNECGETSGQFLRKRFPWIDEVIDKKTDCGQVGSLNLIIQMLSDNAFKYWIHWEESWVAKRPFLQLGMDAMQMGVDQMQFTEDSSRCHHLDDRRVRTPSGKYIYVRERDDDFSHYRRCKRKSSELQMRSRISRFVCREEDESLEWPLWSLRPGMDRVSKVLEVGYFSTNAKMWPVHFELEWAYNWATQKGGVVKAGAYVAFRQAGHVSFSETEAK